MNLWNNIIRIGGFLMKAMIIEKYGKSPLLMADIPTPSVGDYDVLAEIHAAVLILSISRCGMAKLVCC